MAFHGAEIFFRIAIEAQGREERGVVVARSETETRTLVVAHDLDDVVGAELVARTAHAFSAVVVGRDRQRPTAQHTVVVGQQLRGRVGLAIGIEALIDRLVDAQEAAARGADELPHAGGTGLGHRLRLERRLDMRQHRDLGRQALRGQAPGDVLFPDAGALETGAEAIGLPELEAHVVGRLQQLLWRDIGPQALHAPLVVILRHGATGQVAQHLPVVLARRFHLRLAFPRRQVGREMQRLVHDAQAALIVDVAFVGRDLAVDPHPETYIGLEFGGLQDAGIGSAHRLRQQHRRQAQQGQRQERCRCRQALPAAPAGLVAGAT